MRYMSLFRPDRNEQSLLPPTPAEMAAMGKLIEEETKRGILVSTGGLMGSAHGARVHRKGKEVTVIDGPFTETKELVAGFAVMQFGSKAEAIDAAKRFIEVAGDGVCEVRPFFGTGFAAREGATLYMSLWRPAKYQDPSPEMIASMTKLIDEETRAGRMVATGGLTPSDTGTRVSRIGEKVTITDGPFTEAKELVAGFGIFEVASRAEAIGAAQRFLEVVGGGETELRPMFAEGDATCVDKN